MANRERGEVALEVDGKTYVLVMTTNAECEIETLMDTEIEDVYGQLGKARRSALRAVLYGTLREHHASMTLLDAGRLLDADKEKVATAASEAIRLAYDAKGGAAENPPQASEEAGAKS